jgi:hypothetical protein
MSGRRRQQPSGAANWNPIMRRRIDLHVHRSPQGDPHFRAVRRHGSLIMHDGVSPFDPMHHGR